MNRCVVTGMGIITSIGRDVEEFAVSLRKGTIGICDYIENEKKSFRCPIAKVKDFDLKEQAKRYENCNQDDLIRRILKTMRRYPKSIQMDIMAALEAYLQSNIDSNIPSDRRAVIVSGSNLGCSDQFEQYQKYITDSELILPSYAMNFFDTSLVGILSELFDLHGEGFSVGGASASGNSAIIKGMQLIQSGSMDSCMVLGTLADFSPVEIESFFNLGAMCGSAREPEHSCRPFDEEHAGFMLGQTAACIILESEEVAKQRGADVLAQLASGTIKLHGSRLTGADEDYEYKTMKDALERAGMTIDEIDYINAHATSTPMGDITEVNAIKRIEQESAQGHRCYVNSTKSLIAHGIYSAGVAEAIASIIQMRDGFVHANANLMNPIDSELHLVGGEALEAKIDACMSNSFGFGGINSTIILKRSGF